MEAMSQNEWKSFLRECARPAVLAVVQPSGQPHATPVWIEFDGDEIIFTLFDKSLKFQCLQQNPAVSLVVQDERPPFSYVMLNGTVTFSDDRDDLRYWAGRLGARYMGEDRAEEYAERNSVPGELITRLTVEKVRAFKNVAEKAIRIRCGNAGQGLS